MELHLQCGARGAPSMPRARGSTNVLSVLLGHMMKAHVRTQELHKGSGEQILGDSDCDCGIKSAPGLVVVSKSTRTQALSTD